MILYVFRCTIFYYTTCRLAKKYVTLTYVSTKSRKNNAFK